MAFFHFLHAKDSAERVASMKCAFFDKCSVFGLMCHFHINVPFLDNVPFLEKCAIFG